MNHICPYPEHGCHAPVAMLARWRARGYAYVACDGETVYPSDDRRGCLGHEQGYVYALTPIVSHDALAALHASIAAGWHY